MTKKDYILIAQVISAYLDNGDHDMLDGIAGVDVLTRRLATAFQSVNPKFDRARFLKACGLTELK